MYSRKCIRLTNALFLQVCIKTRDFNRPSIILLQLVLADSMDEIALTESTLSMEDHALMVHAPANKDGQVLLVT